MIPMTRVTRWLIAFASVAVLGVFAFPLWRVTLEAPQYPEGIGMLIHVNGVTGVKEHDLENINGLNHYIGMHRIEPDAIPELRYMPWIAGIIALTGLLVAWRGTRAVCIGWCAAVLATLAAGVYDFWHWEYNYGHQLNPDAAIRIPGLTYQPPLFGSKQILNFVANSYPDIGGWMLIVAGVMIGLVLVYLVIAFPTARAHTATVPPVLTAASAVLALWALGGCAPAGPRALIAGTDECAQCRMMISDQRFGGEVVLKTGRVQAFDAVECLSAYVAGAKSATIATVWVTDFDHPGTWIDASRAVFVVGASTGSPMGRSVVALAPGTTDSAATARFGGRVSAWRALIRDANAPVAVQRAPRSAGG